MTDVTGGQSSGTAGASSDGDLATTTAAGIGGVTGTGDVSEAKAFSGATDQFGAGAGGGGTTGTSGATKRSTASTAASAGVAAEGDQDSAVLPLVEAAQARVDEARVWASSQAERARDRVVAEPFKSTAVVFAAGMFVGLLLARR